MATFFFFFFFCVVSFGVCLSSKCGCFSICNVNVVVGLVIVSLVLYASVIWLSDYSLCRLTGWPGVCQPSSVSQILVTIKAASRDTKRVPSEVQIVPSLDTEARFTKARKN